MSARLRSAVIGFGAIGRHHARNLNDMPDVELVGIYDPRSEACRDAERLGYDALPSLDAVLASKLRLAVVSVPTAHHHAIALRLIDAGIAVLVEKPIALSVADGREIIAAAERHGVPLMVGYVERYNPALIVTREFVGKGNIGTPISIATRRIGALPPRIQDANVIVDIGVHDIDAIAFLTRQHLRLVSAQGGFAILGDRVDYASLALDACGLAAHAQMNWITPVKVRDLTITGTEGYVHVDYLRQEARFAPAREFMVTESFEEVVAQYEEGRMYSLPSLKREPLRTQLETFVAGIRGAELPQPSLAIESLEIALLATEAITARQRSFA